MFYKDISRFDGVTGAFGIVNVVMMYYREVYVSYITTTQPGQQHKPVLLDFHCTLLGIFNTATENKNKQTNRLK